MPDKIKISGQNRRVMDVLWRLKTASTGQVLRALGDGLAYTTVATMLSRLEKRGLITSDFEGRERIYRPVLEQDEARRSIVGEVLSTMFRGDPKALVAHLLEEREIGSEDLDELQRMIEDKRRS